MATAPATYLTFTPRATRASLFLRGDRDVHYDGRILHMMTALTAASALDNLAHKLGGLPGSDWSGTYDCLGMDRYSLAWQKGRSYHATDLGSAAGCFSGMILLGKGSPEVRAVWLCTSCMCFNGKGGLSIPAYWKTGLDAQHIAALERSAATACCNHAATQYRPIARSISGGVLIWAPYSRAHGSPVTSPK